MGGESVVRFSDSVRHFEVMSKILQSLRMYELLGPPRNLRSYSLFYKEARAWNLTQHKKDKFSVRRTGQVNHTIHLTENDTLCDSQRNLGGRIPSK